MNIEWDLIKAKINEQKHGIAFADAMVVLDDPMAVTIDDDCHTEERFVTIGMDGRGRILVVVHTYRGEENIRIISARTATLRERFQYVGG